MNPRQILYSKNYSCNRTPEVLIALTTIIMQSTGLDQHKIHVDLWHPSNSNFLDKMMHIRYIISMSNKYGGKGIMNSVRCDIAQFMEIYNQNTRHNKLEQLLC